MDTFSLADVDETPMNVPAPHYLLFLQADSSRSGRWRFSLETPDGSERLEAEDSEPEVRGDRLHLLMVIRGLEAIDQPARVTLIGCSPYVRRGINYGLPEWRENGWRWEWFGQMVPVRNGDLWQRLDHALRFHKVECRQWRIDGPHGGPSPPDAGGGAENSGWGLRVGVLNWLKCAGFLKPARWPWRLAAAIGRRRQMARQPWIRGAVSEQVGQSY
jgi:ribonuclease HI